MTRRTSRLLLIAIIWFAVFAMGAAAISGRDREFSLDLWLAVAASWLAWLIATRLAAAAPVRAERLAGVWRKGRARPAPRDTRARDLVVLEGLLVGARDNPRANHNRLRPRLKILADHLLRTRHGVDLARQPERAASVLGDVWWLIDDDADRERCPSLTEIDHFVDILMAETETDMTTTRGTR